MSAVEKRLEALIVDLRDSWTPEERELIKTVSADLASLTVQKLQGGEVRTELRHVHAQAAALFAASSITMKDVLLESLRDFLKELASDLIPGL